MFSIFLPGLYLIIGNNFELFNNLNIDSKERLIFDFGCILKFK